MCVAILCPQLVQKAEGNVAFNTRMVTRSCSLNKAKTKLPVPPATSNKCMHGVGCRSLIKSSFHTLHAAQYGSEVHCTLQHSSATSPVNSSTHQIIHHIITRGDAREDFGDLNISVKINLLEVSSRDPLFLLFPWDCPLPEMCGPRSRAVVAAAVATAEMTEIPEMKSMR